MSQQPFFEIVERYCPYVNRNVALKKGPQTVCMESEACPMQARAFCKNQPKSNPTA